jgi:hypothetical protein
MMCKASNMLDDSGMKTGQGGKRMRHFSSRLSWLLFIKGVCRAIPPLYVLWSTVEWLRIEVLCAVIFGVLTWNYVLLYILSWVQPSLMQGPWRVRPVQTFILLANAIVLPIMFYRIYGHLPWVFLASAVLCFASLFIGTVIYIHLNRKLPMGAIFAATRSPGLPAAPTAPR